MSLASRLGILWKNVMRRGRVEAELDDEISATFELYVQEKLNAGLSPDAARRATRLELGDADVIKDGVRDVRSGEFLASVLRDMRYGWRTLARNPLFTVTAVLSLAVSIGANTTVFAIVDALLFAVPSGVTEPRRVVDVIQTQSGPGLQHSYPDYLDIRDGAASFAGVYASQLVATPMSLLTSQVAEHVAGKAVSTNYFDVLGALPAVGRLLRPTDSDQPGASPYVVLSYDYWTRRFNRDSSIVGRSLEINHQPLMVIGVTREGFCGTNIATTDLWVSLGMLAGAADADSFLTSRTSTPFAIGGRLRPGVSIAQASAELHAIGSRLDQSYPDIGRRRRFRVVPASLIPDTLAAPVATFLSLLMGIAMVVLAIACANLAGVLLARATARAREIAVRVAVGAGRARVVQQLLTETLLLFILGGIAGILLARVSLSLLIGLLPALPVGIAVSPQIDFRVAGSMALATLVAALMAGLSPAWEAARTDVISALKGELHAQPQRGRLRSVFVIAQVCLSLVLVITAGLLARGLQRASTFDPGYKSEGVELLSVDLSTGQYNERTGTAFIRDLLERIRHIPNVQEATVAVSSQVSDSLRSLSVADSPGALSTANVNFAEWVMTGPGYFSTLQIPIVEGRDFNDSDQRTSAPVAVISSAVARRFWPGQHAVGQTLFIQEGRPGRSNPNSKPAEAVHVVGVAQDLHYRGAGETTSRLVVYSPLLQHYTPTVTVVTRSGGTRVTHEIRALIASMNAGLPINSMRMLSDVTAISLMPQRIAAWASGAFGIVGIVLASIGVYGITAYTVQRRTREIGIRVALGATRMGVVSLVLRRGMSLVAIGSVVGLAFAAATSRLLAGLLSGLPSLDPVTFIGATALFTAIGLTACAIPVMRATRIAATDALRTE